MGKFEIRTHVVLNVAIIIAGLIIGGFFLLFGVANLINPDVPDAYLKQNTRICLLFTVISLVPLLAVIAAIRGIINRKNNRQSHDKTG